MHMHLNSL